MGKRVTGAFLALFLVSVHSEVLASSLQFRVSEKSVAEGNGRSLVFQSKAKGRVPYAVSGLGTIKSGVLSEGATREVRFKKEGIVQFRIGKGKNIEKGVVPVRANKQALVLVTGTSPIPKESVESAPPAGSTDYEFSPLSENEFHFRNPYGAAFEKLTTAEKIRVVLESPETARLSREEKRDLLGFLYNQKGVEEANAEHFSEAEKSLKTALQYLGSLGRVLSNYAFVIAIQGNRDAVSGNLRRGEKRLAQAMKLLEDLDDPHLRDQVARALAGVYTKFGLNLPSTDRSKKEMYFHKALEYDPTQAVALFELGQIAYTNYELEKAIDFYEASYRVSRDPSVAKLIEKVKTEFAEAGDFRTQDRGVFKISFEGRSAKDVAQVTRKLLADAQRDVGRAIGLRPNDTIPVVIYSAGQFQSILGLHSWAGAAYDGKIRLPIGELNRQDLKLEEKRIRQIVYHEYAHAVFQSHMGQRRAPIWFQEGIAQLAAGETPQIGDPNWVIRGLTTGMIPTPTEMSGQFSSVRDGQMASALYFASFSFVRYLIEEHGGWSRLRRLIDRLIDGNSMADAFRTTYRRSLAQIEEEWLVALERRDPSAY